ncbi:hypothetical protein [Raoultibacter timonensis]|uniref:hypothetical protein n=1 Tax=Raoultibacter timonensis TaxID=1907662 RepID=UPI000C86646F|nr:hypothetical protein [Raoultibacter timonensis]
MKRSNWIILAVLVAACGFFLWLWYYLGFNLVDNPLDLLLAVVWWVAVIGIVLGIRAAEKRRQKRIRTMYVADSMLFNSEAGLLNFVGSDQLVAVMNRVLRDLDYDFTTQELPEREEFKPGLLVKTEKYGNDNWTGEVVVIESQEQQPFESKEELASLLDDCLGCCTR